MLLGSGTEWSSQEGVAEVYKSVTIRNFRGFDELTVDGLTRVNLIVGDNGTGKTSLLEALFLLAGDRYPGRPVWLAHWRGLTIRTSSAQAAFDNLFREFDLNFEERAWQPIIDFLTAM